jgi:pimeloyl-ACP methyl ester carboxylesterase
VVEARRAAYRYAVEKSTVAGSGMTVELFYEDEGAGSPVVLIRDESIPDAAWKRQIRGFLVEGHRVVSYDRREYGRSSAANSAARFTNDPSASDLNRLVTSLNLQQVAVIAHATGTGDVIRYLGQYGSQRVIRAALIAPLPAFSREDVKTSADFRADLRSIDVPVLIVAGIDPRFVQSPIARHTMSYNLAASKTLLFPASSGSLLAAHAAEVNAALLQFFDA